MSRNKVDYDEKEGELSEDIVTKMQTNHKKQLTFITVRRHRHNNAQKQTNKATKQTKQPNPLQEFGNINGYIIVFSF